MGYNNEKKIHYWGPLSTVISLESLKMRRVKLKKRRKKVEAPEDTQVQNKQIVKIPNLQVCLATRRHQIGRPKGAQFCLIMPPKNGQTTFEKSLNFMKINKILHFKILTKISSP